MTWTRETVRARARHSGPREHAQAGAEVIEESSHLVADLSLDSLGVMEVVADIEDKFQLSIPDEVLREVDTVADVVKAIELRLKNEGRLEDDGCLETAHGRAGDRGRSGEHEDRLPLHRGVERRPSRSSRTGASSGPARASAARSRRSGCRRAIASR